MGVWGFGEVGVGGWGGLGGSWHFGVWGLGRGLWDWRIWVWGHLSLVGVWDLGGSFQAWSALLVASLGFGGALSWGLVVVWFCGVLTLGVSELEEALVLGAAGLREVWLQDLRAEGSDFWGPWGGLVLGSGEL